MIPYETFGIVLCLWMGVIGICHFCKAIDEDTKAGWFAECIIGVLFWTIGLVFFMW